jgi:hypothetical protein
MIGRSLVFEGYGASVRVDIPYRMDLEDLKSYVAPELAVEKSAPGPPDLLLTCWNGVCHLVLGQRRYGPYRTEENAFRGLANGIHFLVGKRSPMTFLHAGAVELDGGAVVFPGRSRWGKSTLVASLVEQGCGYLSDEYAVVSPEGTVFPFSKPIRLRRGGNGATYYHLPGVGLPGGFPCAAVVLTRFEEGTNWDPKAVSVGEAILRTLPAALGNRDEPEKVLGALRALVQDAACYEGERGDSEPTIASIRELKGVSDFSLEVSS